MGQRVYTFDRATQKSKFIAEGSNPCWAPDGQSIALISAGHKLTIYRLTDNKGRIVATGSAATGYPRWSPDSKYVLFTQYDPRLVYRDLLTLPSTDLVVVRIIDAATMVVLAPGMGGDNREYYCVKSAYQQRH